MSTDFHFISKNHTSPHIDYFRLKVPLMLLLLCLCTLSTPSSVSAYSFSYSVPEGEDIYAYLPVSEPEFGDQISTEKPLGLGSAASGGSMIDLEFSIPSFLFPVDVYLGIMGDVFGDEIYLFTTDDKVVALSTTREDIRFRKGTYGNSYGTLFKDIPVSALPPSNYIFMLLVTPEDSFSSYVAWITSLDLTGNKNNPPPGSNGTGGGTSGAVAGKLLSGLGNMSSNKFSDAVRVLVSTIQEGSVDMAAATLASRYPDLISKTSSGFKVDWGAGKTMGGVTIAGSMAIDLKQHQSGESVYDSSRTVVKGGFNIALKDLVLDGTAIPDDTLTLSMQADVIPGGDIQGQVSIPGSYSGATGGSVIFDTRECPQYPVAGYLEIDDDIVNVTQGCTGTYTAGGRDMPTLTSVSPAQVNSSSAATVIIHGSNMWPPYDVYKDGDEYNYRCHLRKYGSYRLDSNITDWTPDRITLTFRPYELTKETLKLYLECPWSTGYWDNSDTVTIEVK
jgi:hypothetical protein